MQRLAEANWSVTDHGGFVEVMPIGDLQTHYLGDECWCAPKVVREADSRPMISHNALDKRK